MKIQSVVLLLIVGTWGTISFATAQCVQPMCFDCNTCNKNCNDPSVKQNCDTDCVLSVRKFLCQMENENCVKAYGCDIPPVPITIFPAAYYDESRPEIKSQTIDARKNCCYKLTGIYDKTLSGVKNNGACIELFVGSDCTGATLKIDSTWSPDCLKWIDCSSRLNAGGAAFNDKTSSFRLC